MRWTDFQVSRKRLEMAMQVLERQNVYDPDLLMYKTALGMVRSASLNCYIFDVSPSWYNMTSTHLTCVFNNLLLFQCSCKASVQVILRCRQKRVTPLRQRCPCFRGSWALAMPAPFDS